MIYVKRKRGYRLGKLDRKIDRYDDLLWQIVYLLSLLLLRRSFGFRNKTTNLLIV